MADGREKRLERLEQAAGVNIEEEGLDVEWRDAAPDERPDGLEWDADERRLSFDFWAAQWEALDALEEGDADLVGFVAGYRSGKSILGARWVLSNALEHPGTRHLVMGQDFTKAQGATYRVLHSQLPGEQTELVTSGFNGPEQSPIVEDYNRTRHTLALANGSVIVLGAGDRWSRHAGDEFASIWADEVAHYDESVHDILEMLGSRLTSDAGPNRQLWTTTGAGYNDVHDILEKRVDEDGDGLGLNIELIRASVLENPYLDEATRDRLKRQYVGTGREEQALHGGFAAATGLVYKNFNREEHVIPHEAAEAFIAEDEEAYRLYGYDSGWRDPRVCIELGLTGYGQVIVLDEFYESESHVDDVIEWLRSRPIGPVFCEHVPAEVDRMKRQGVNARQADKNLDAGISAVRERFEADEAGEPGLLVSDRCRNLIHELQSYQREQVGTSAAEDHCADALRYAIMGVENGSFVHNVAVAFG